MPKVVIFDRRKVCNFKSFEVNKNNSENKTKILKTSYQYLQNRELAVPLQNIKTYSVLKKTSTSETSTSYFS